MLRASFLLLFSAALVAHTAENAAASAPAPRIFLITDYLPLALYEGDSVTACFRVENAGSVKANLSVRISSFNAEGKQTEESREKIAVEHNGFAKLQHNLEVSKRTRILYELLSDKETLATAAVLLLRDKDLWPRTQVVNRRLCAMPGGEIIVPVVQKRVHSEDRSFAPVKWIFGNSVEQKPQAAATLACIPEALHLNLKGPMVVRLQADQQSALPLLSAVAQIAETLSASKKEAFECAIIVLPADDLALGIEPRTYRIGLEMLLARLKHSGVKTVFLMPPADFGADKNVAKRLLTEVRGAGTAYGATVLDPSAFLNEKHWRVDPAVEGVYSPKPNADGRKILEQTLTDLVR